MRARKPTCEPMSKAALNSDGRPRPLIAPDPVLVAHGALYRTGEGAPLEPVFEVVGRFGASRKSLDAETAWIVRLAGEGHRLRNLGHHKAITRRAVNGARWWAERKTGNGR